jgi:hypothetical protein
VISREVTGILRLDSGFSVFERLERLFGLVVKVPGYTTEMYCASCEVQTEFIYVMEKKVDHLFGLVVRVPGYRTEMCCVSCKVRTEFMLCRRK